jgi:hypothetical protein
MLGAATVFSDDAGPIASRQAFVAKAALSGIAIIS